MRGHSIDEGLGPVKISEKLKKRFHEALKGRLAVLECATCPQSRSFVPVVEFLIGMITDATGRMDIASQRMEDFIELFEQLENNSMKKRFEEPGDDGR